MICLLFCSLTISLLWCCYLDVLAGGLSLPRPATQYLTGGWLGLGREKKKKDGGEKLYLRKQWTLMLEWPSDFLQLLSLFRHAVQPAHHFAPAFHLLFVKNATCTLWQVHNPTSHVSCMCSFCGPPFHTIHPTHPAKASGEKRVAQRAANNIPFVTPLRTFTSCDTCAVIICECIRKAVRRLFVMC